MKIVVYNHSDQYALSSQQVEAIQAVLPAVLWTKIAEFHLCEDRRNAEMFEYSEGLKVAFFSCPVKEKTTTRMTHAIRELLVGLARLKAHSRFYLPLKDAERLVYEEFVAQWLPKCIAATTSKS